MKSLEDFPFAARISVERNCNPSWLRKRKAHLATIANVHPYFINLTRREIAKKLEKLKAMK